MDVRCSLVSQSQKRYSGITSSSLLPLLGPGWAESTFFLLLPKKVEGVCGSQLS